MDPGMGSDVDVEESVLTTEWGRQLLDVVAGTPTPLPSDLARWRKHAPPAAVAAALRLVANRRRGAAKFARAERMWFDARGLEQATSEAVARHKARRFAAPRVVDLCCGIGGDTLALAAATTVLAVDADEGMCRRCRWNARAYDVAGRVDLVRARAERIAVPPGSLVHVDPDRRSRDGPRAQKVRDYAPGLDFLHDLTSRATGGAIKLGPASDFDAHFAAAGREIELISLDGECKEATVWFGSLATCRRRATRLPGGATWTDRDGPTTPTVPITGPRGWLFDPDPALIRSGLLDGFARVHGLGRCAEGIDYLTAPTAADSPFLAAFEVAEVLPLDVKILKREVRVRDLGPLEIKARGVAVRPEALRAQLRPTGTYPATLILIGGPGASVAVLAHRRERR
jgi:SAM-dependent methyltransferase